MFSLPAALLFLGAGLPCANSQMPGNAPRVETTFQPKVSPDLAPMAREAREDFDQGKYGDAEQVYNKLIARDPENPYLLSNLGVVLFRESKLDSAVAMLEKAAAAAPKDAFTRETLGIVYYSMHNYDAAVRCFVQAIELDPKNAAAHNFVGAATRPDAKPASPAPFQDKLPPADANISARRT